MKQAVVFFDVDGTLISGKTGLIPASAAEAIRRLTERGHIPVVNTGRPYGHVQPQVKALAVRGYVCSCGMYLRMNDRVIQDVRPDRALCLQMRELVIDCRLDSIFETIDSAFIIHTFFESYERECTAMGKAGVKLRYDVMAEDFRFDKFVVWNNENSDFERFAREAEKYFTLIPRHMGFTELVPLGCSKGSGIRTFLDSLPPAERTVYAFGDSTNDLEMFRMADVSVLMGDGNQELRSETDYVTTAVDDDGIQQALERFGLI